MKRTLQTLPSRRYMAGFTLIELVVTVSVFAILISIAVPSFTSIIRKGQIETTTNGLVGAFNVARSEASKRGVAVTVCASTNGTSCSGGTNWSTSWIIFTDTGVIGTIDATGSPPDLVLKNLVSSASGMSVVGSDPFVNFTTTGAVNFAISNPVTFVVTKSGCGAKEKRQISILTTTGRSNLAIKDCP